MKISQYFTIFAIIMMAATLSGCIVSVAVPYGTPVYYMACWCGFITAPFGLAAMVVAYAYNYWGR